MHAGQSRARSSRSGTRGPEERCAPSAACSTPTTDRLGAIDVGSGHRVERHARRAAAGRQHHQAAGVGGALAEAVQDKKGRIDPAGRTQATGGGGGGLLEAFHPDTSLTPPTSTC